MRQNSVFEKQDNRSLPRAKSDILQMSNLCKCKSVQLGGHNSATSDELQSAGLKMVSFFSALPEMWPKTKGSNQKVHVLKRTFLKPHFIDLWTFLAVFNHNL